MHRIYQVETRYHTYYKSVPVGLETAETGFSLVWLIMGMRSNLFSSSKVHLLSRTQLERPVR